jgi:hypothetical protein
MGECAARIGFGPLVIQMRNLGCAGRLCEGDWLTWADKGGTSCACREKQKEGRGGVQMHCI